MGYSIRKAEISDAESLCRLNGKSLGYDYPAEKTAEILKIVLRKDHEAVFVAEEDGNAVGYVHIAEYGLLFAEKGVNVLGIAVAPQYTGKGIGRALMNKVEEWASERGATYVRLVSGETRTGAHAFYEKCGFTSNKMQKNFKKNL